MQNPIIVITGATASGKTALSFALAKKYKGEIICADSMTVYRGMDIGTDKPTLIQNSKFKIQNSDGSYTINGVRHHLLDVLDPDEEFNVSIFCDLVDKKVKEIWERGCVPFLVGGSLLYIDSYVYNYTLPSVKPDLNLRKKLEEEDLSKLWRRLVSLDPDAEWTIDRHNRRRVVRALEVCLKTGKPFTSQKSRKTLKENVLYLVMDKPREELYRAINYRVDEMMNQGLLTEVTKLYEKYDHNSAMQASGYRQLLEYLDHKTNLEEAIENTKRSHRNFAKKQLTWLRRNTDKIIIHNEKEAESSVAKFLKAKN